MQVRIAMKGVVQSYARHVEIGQDLLGEAVTSALDSAFLAQGQWGPLSALPLAREATLGAAVAASSNAFAKLREVLARFVQQFVQASIQEPSIQEAAREIDQTAPTVVCVSQLTGADWRTW